MPVTAFTARERAAALALYQRALGSAPRRNPADGGRSLRVRRPTEGTQGDPLKTLIGAEARKLADVSLVDIAVMPLRVLLQRGLSQAAAHRIRAAFALAIEAAQAQPVERVVLRLPGDVVAFMRPRIGLLMHEEFWAIAVDKGLRVISAYPISRGGISATTADPRTVFRPAIEANANAIFLIHNHPSASPQPSDEDRASAQTLIQAGKHIGIQVLDSLVIGRPGWASAVNRFSRSAED